MALSINHSGEGREILFGQESHLAVSRKRGFAEMIFWLLSERQPNAAELKVFELIFNLSIDHGPNTPSAKITIESAKAGKTIGEAVAAGVREINDTHGGAQEALMPILYKIVKEKAKPEAIVADFVKKKIRLPGFGHRLYKNTDPRAELILDTLGANNLGRDFITVARNLAEELRRQTGKVLPLNIDGAIAVTLCAFGWPPALGKAVFIIARTPGLCGQFINHHNKA